MVITQLVSGVWHGVFAGYWLFFATSAFMFHASRLVYRYEATWSPRLRNFPPWILFKIVASALVLSYAGSAFMVLSLQGTLEIWRSLSFFGHVIILAVILIGAVMPPKRPKAAALEPTMVNGAGGAAVDPAPAAEGEPRAKVE